MSVIQLAERRWLPDSVIRFGMRRLLRERLADEETRAAGDYNQALDEFADRMRQSVTTIETHLANEQHYEVPAEFFELMLGHRLKYSCGLWQESTTSLDQSEDAMLRLCCERAGLEDGMRLLDLGCGWGSLSLWVAENYRNCEVVALSNSHSQREWIERQSGKRGLENLKVVTADVGDVAVNDHNAAHDVLQAGTFDRVMSVEMFEHVRNHEALLDRIATWLKADGRLFVHIFCHRNLAYTFETEGQKNWMGRHFFSGGMMPAKDLFARYDKSMNVEDQWWISGMHYAKTCRQWLDRLDANPRLVKGILGGATAEHGPDGDSSVMLQRWRMFVMACEELFRFEGGAQWGVGHYLFRPVMRP